jgi:TonB family protein
MFDRVANGKARRNRWKAPMLLSGALIHGALFTGMWAKGLWQINKVEAAENDLTLTVPAPIPVPETPQGAPKPPTVTAKRVAKDPVQPTRRPEQKPVDVPGTDDPPTGTPTTGDIDGPVMPPSDIPVMPIPDVVLPKPPPPMAKPPQQRNVAPAVLEQQRIAGNKIITPDEETAQQIARGDGKVKGVVRLCLGSDGVVRSANIVVSTEFPAYDAKLEREIRNWRYQPYQVDGVATPVCTNVTFLYRQR